MYTARTNSSKYGGGDGSHRLEPLYAEDELEVLREEILEAYTVPREKMITRDEVNEIKRTDFAVKETRRLTEKKAKEEDVILKLKAKQDALRRLYENVLTENKRTERSKRDKRRSESEESFHEMYTVYHDPETRVREGMKRVLEKERLEPLIKVVESTKLPEHDEDASKTKPRSMFVMKSPGKSKPPPLLYGDGKMSITEAKLRQDVRYSVGHDRFSFDVDVQGPFLHYVDPKKIPPTVRHVGTQAFLVETDGPLMGDVDSQTEMDMSGFRYSFGSDNEEEAGGDASSSNPSDKEYDKEETEGDDFGKTLERKESKRREAQTMARPRGYRDLHLNVQMPIVTFEAETSVTAYDLEKEMAKQRGYVLTRDNIVWPTIKEFDIDTASRKIEDYIKRCWNLDSKWLFFVQPVEVYHDNYRKKYVFEVKFSVPSPITPVPPATASVFFIFEMSLYAATDKLKVTYVLEGTRYAHKPGRIPFQDKWLWGIITDKLRVQKSVNF